MKILKYLSMAVAMMFVAVSCEKEIENPEFTDSDLVVFFYGQGGDPHGIAWEGFDVMLGESLDVKMQVSPKNETDVKWELHEKTYVIIDGDTLREEVTATLLNETLEYTFTPEEEGLQRTYFIATRPSGVADTVVFNFRGVSDITGGNSVQSIIDAWQNFEIPQGVQTGTFTAEFDMVAEKDNIDALVGFSSGEASGFGDLSAIVRFTNVGTFDARDGTGYGRDAEIPYSAGLKYHVRMEVDVMNMMYDVFISSEGGDEVQLADDYGFRAQFTNISYWSVIAGTWQVDDPGVHTVSDMVITTNTVNEFPVISEIPDVVMNEGTEKVVNVSVSNPLAGELTLTAANLPRFAIFNDLGNGNGEILLKPYADCGGCDVGSFDITITATNVMGSVEEAFNVTVEAVFNTFEIVLDAADVTLSKDRASGVFNAPYEYKHLFGGVVNFANGSEEDLAAVMPFALPVIPEGKKIESAYLKINVVSVAGNGSYDLHVVDEVRTASTVLNDDFYVGAYDGSTNSTPLQNGIVNSSTAAGELLSDDNSANALAAFMNDLYANGSTSGEFIFLRINDDSGNLTPSDNFQFKSEGTDVAGTEPVLVVTLTDI